MERIRPYLEGAQLYEFGEPRLSNLSTAIGAVETTPARMAMAMALIDPRSSDPRIALCAERPRIE